MQIADYEKVSLNTQFPAMIFYLDEKTINIDQNPTIAAHWHRSIEMTLVTSGSLLLSINGEQKRIHKNEFIFVNSGEIHNMSLDGKNTASAIISILSYDYLKKLFPDIDHVYFDILKAEPIIERLYEIFYDLKAYSINPAPLEYIKINAYICEIWYLLLKYCQSSFPAGSFKRYEKDRNRQKEILTYINENYQNGISLEEIANKFYMSSEHFSRMFHKSFNITFNVYINELRLFKSYGDVINTKDTIGSIAARYGFSNIKSFIEQFKTKYGKTPYKYRSFNKISINDNNLDNKEQQSLL